MVSLNENSKVCVVTGGNSGIGFHVALQLATSGSTVILIARNLEKLTVARQRIIQLTGNDRIQVYEADLAINSDIEQVAGQISRSYDYIDVLIHNAACVSSERVLTPDGVELQFAVNHLAPFRLTHFLLPLLVKGKQGRIVLVNSRAHARGTVNFNDLFLEKGYGLSKAYNQSKLANMMFGLYLAGTLVGTSVTVNVFHPGLVNTDIGNKQVSAFDGFLWSLIKRIGKTPAASASDGTYLALSDTLTGVSGKFFHNKRIIKPSEKAYDKKAAEKLWKLSLQLSGIQDNAYGKVS